MCVLLHIAAVRIRFVSFFHFEALEFVFQLLRLVGPAHGNVGLMVPVDTKNKNDEYEGGGHPSNSHANPDTHGMEIGHPAEDVS